MAGNIDTSNPQTVVHKPLPYGLDGQSVLGHYAVGIVSGAIAATPTALDVHSSFRWAPSLPTALAVLTRIKLGWAVISAVTTGIRIAYSGTIARGWSSDFTTAATACNLAAPNRTGAMRSLMGASLMGTTGPRIATTAPQTTVTYTLDANPFAITEWPTVTNVNATGTAVALQPGSAGAMQTLYEWTANGQHPIVLSNQEGVVIRIVHTGWADGTVALYAQYEWAEVVSF